MHLPEPRPIREYDGVDRRRFLEDIRPLRQPAVLRGLASNWPAVEAARRSDEELVAYLKRFGHARPVPVIAAGPEIEGRFFYTDDLSRLNFQQGAAPLSAFLGHLLTERDSPRPIAMALQSATIAELLTGFEKENEIDLLDRKVTPRAWIGNRIRVVPHYDLKENIGCVVAGRRRFTVFPPEQLPNLYPGPFELTPAGTPVSLVDIDDPDLDRFPRFAEAAATAQSAVLGPGDAIYLPFHWWHGVDSLEPVNLFVNYWWNDAPHGLGSPYDALMHAFFALKPLPPEQREVWRMVFDHFVFGLNGDPAAHLPPHARGVLGAPSPEQLARMRAMLKQILGRL